MAEVGVMITAAGVVTTLDLNYVPEAIQIGTIDTDLPLDSYSVTINGVVTQFITGNALILAVSKYLRESLLGADIKIGMVIPIGDGKNEAEGVTFQMKLENDGATTPKIYAHSSSYTEGGTIRTSQNTIQDTSNQAYENFTALFFSSTNLSNAMITFDDGLSERYEAVEIAALFNVDNQSDADGKLGATNCIDNSEGNIESVVLYTSGGTLSVVRYDAVIAE